jgi:acetate kinase
MHLPPAIAVIRAFGVTYPDTPQTASFDTAFHSSQSNLASRFAIPEDLHNGGVRRYGFHGLSYKYISGALKKLDPDLAAGRVICAHLGSGASLCAMVDGVSIDTSMGFSALDGIPMATRPGALDPGVILYLLRNKFRDADRLEEFLYHRCGLFGLSGRSGDVRVLLEDFHPASREALDLFCFRIAGEIGRLAVSLGGIDAIVFTAGIGEHQPEIRKGVAQHLSLFGVGLSEVANKANATVISARESEVAVLVIPTDEEQVIADEAVAVINRHKL